MCTEMVDKWMANFIYLRRFWENRLISAMKSQRYTMRHLGREKICGRNYHIHPFMTRRLCKIMLLLRWLSEMNKGHYEYSSAINNVRCILRGRRHSSSTLPKEVTSQSPAFASSEPPKPEQLRNILTQTFAMINLKFTKNTVDIPITIIIWSSRNVLCVHWILRWERWLELRVMKLYSSINRRHNRW